MSEKKTKKVKLATLPVHAIYSGLRHELKETQERFRKDLSKVWGTDWSDKNPDRPQIETVEEAIRYYDNHIRIREENLAALRQEKADFIRNMNYLKERIKRIEHSLPFLEYDDGDAEISVDRIITDETEEE